MFMSSPRRQRNVHERLLRLIDRTEQDVVKLTARPTASSKDRVKAKDRDTDFTVRVPLGDKTAVHSQRHNIRTSNHSKSPSQDIHRVTKPKAHSPTQKSRYRHSQYDLLVPKYQYGSRIPHESADAAYKAVANHPRPSNEWIPASKWHTPSQDTNASTSQVTFVTPPLSMRGDQSSGLVNTDHDVIVLSDTGKTSLLHSIHF